MEDQAITDEMLLSIKDDPVYRAKLTPEERGRLSALVSGDQKPQAQVRSRTGQMYTPPTESMSGDFLAGAAANVDPRTYLAMGQKALTDPLGLVKDVAMSPVRIAGGLVTEPAKTLGSLTGAAALGPLAEGTGTALKAAAPAIYETGLGRTTAMRRSFPNAATEGIAQGITNPSEANVTARLNTVEGQLKGATGAHDAAVDATTAGPALRADTGAIAEEAKALVMKRAGLIAPNQAGGSAARASRSAAIQQLDRLAAGFTNENDLPLTSQGTLSLKRGQQDLANSAYLKAERGAPVNDIKTLWDEATAEVARKRLLSDVPDAEGMLRQQQGLLGLKQAANRTQPIIPGTDMGAIRRFVLEHPAIMSKIGVSADRLGSLAMNPRLLRTVQTLMTTAGAAPQSPE